MNDSFHQTSIYEIYFSLLNSMFTFWTGLCIFARNSTPSSNLSIEEKIAPRRGSHDGTDRIHNNNNIQQHQQQQQTTATSATTTTSRQNSLGLPEPPGGHQPRRLSDCGPITQHQQGKHKYCILIQLYVQVGQGDLDLCNFIEAKVLEFIPKSQHNIVNS